MQNYRFGAVIPAAGLSSRMGAFKPLLPLGKQTVIEASVSSVLPYVCTASVVVGFRGGEVASVLRESFGEQIAITQNPDYASTDMLRSVQLGLRALGECDAFFLLPGDMPLIAPRVFEMLCDSFDSSRDVLYPVIDGRRGHPPLISASQIPEILAYRGKGGLRAILSGCSAEEIAVSEPGIFTDLDTPDDYERCR